MSCDSQTEQQIWELIYGVLPPDQGTEILRRISSDPDVARAYARIKLLADVVAEGAKLDADAALPSVSFIALAMESSVKAGQAAGQAVGRRPLWQLAVQWSLAAAALGLVTLTGTGWWLTQRNLPTTGGLIASREASGPEVGVSQLEMAMPSRVSQEQPTLILVSSRDALGRPLAAGVELTVSDPDYGLLWQGSRNTDPRTGILTDAISGSELTRNSKRAAERAASLPVRGGPSVAPPAMPLPGFPPSQLAERGAARQSASGLRSAAPAPASSSSPELAEGLAASSGRVATAGSADQARPPMTSRAEADPNSTVAAAPSAAPEASKALAVQSPAMRASRSDGTPRTATSNRSLPAADAVSDAGTDTMPRHSRPVSGGDQSEERKQDLPATVKRASPRPTLTGLADRSRLQFQARTDSGETINATAEWQHDTNLTFVTIDREVYRAGDVVRFRSVTLSRSRLLPTDQQELEISIRRAAGQPIPELTMMVESRLGVAEGQLRLPAELPEGDYLLVARSPLANFPTLERRFVVQRLVADPQARGEGSAPGGDATAGTGSLDPAAGASQPNEASRPAGETEPQPNGQPLSAPPTAPAQPSASSPSAAEPGGVNASSRDAAAATENQHAAAGPQTGTARDLPGQTNPAGDPRADRDSTVASATGPQQSDTVRTRQAILNSTDDGLGFASRPTSAVTERVRFYPEGGVLVAGVPNRVYFTTTGHGQPKDQPLELVDGSGRVVTAAVLHHTGLGSFTWTPQAGQTYWLRSSGSGESANAFSVPPCDPTAEVTLQADPSVLVAGAPLVVRLKSRMTPQRLLVQVSCRGETVALAVVRATDFQTSQQRASDSRLPRSSQPQSTPSARANRNSSPAESVASRDLAASEVRTADGLSDSQHADRSVKPLADDDSTLETVEARESANPLPRVKSPLEVEPDAEEARLAADDSAEKSIGEPASTSAVEESEEPAWMQAELILPLHGNAAGVLRLTVFELGSQPPRPLAERLVYRDPRQQLRIALDNLSERHEPGAEVTFRIRTYDEWHRPVATQLGAMIVGESLASQATEGPNDTSIPPQASRLSIVAPSRHDSLDRFFLGFEDRWGKRWAEPSSWERRIGVATPLSFLTSTDWARFPISEPHAAVLDAVLATVGWRRFVIGPVLGSWAEHVDQNGSLPVGPDRRPAAGGLLPRIGNDRPTTVADLTISGVATEPQATPVPRAAGPAAAPAAGPAAGPAAAPADHVSSGSSRDDRASEEAGQLLDSIDPTIQQFSGGKRSVEPVTDLPLFLTHISIEKTPSVLSGGGKPVDGLAASPTGRRWGPIVAVLSLLLLSLIVVVRNVRWLPNLRWERALIASSLVTLLIGVSWSFRASETGTPPSAHVIGRDHAKQHEPSLSGLVPASDKDGEQMTPSRTASAEPISPETSDEKNRSSDIAVDASDSPASDQAVSSKLAETKQPSGRSGAASWAENRSPSAVAGSGLAGANAVAGNPEPVGGGQGVASQSAAGRANSSLENPATHDELASRTPGSAVHSADHVTATTGTVYYREFAWSDESGSEGRSPDTSGMPAAETSDRPASARTLAATADFAMARPVDAAPASSTWLRRSVEQESLLVSAADDRSGNAGLDVVPVTAANDVLNRGGQQNPVVADSTGPPSRPSPQDPSSASAVAARPEMASDKRWQFWFPRLAASTLGETTFTIRLPDQPGHYWLRLDGHTLDGRISSLLQRIDVGVAPSE
jgi:hypothetical protein